MSKNHTTDSCYLKLCIIFLVVIVFLVEFIQNGSSYAEENYKKCLEFINADDLDELKELRLCIKKINIANELEKTRIIRKKSYDGSLDLTEKLLSDNKSSKITQK